jgi:hypothetical protein
MIQSFEQFPLRLDLLFRQRFLWVALFATRNPIGSVSPTNDNNGKQL